MESSQLIQDYLDGRLTEEQKVEFKHRLENESEFKQEKESLERIEKELSILGAENFKGRVQQFEEDFKSTQIEHRLKPARSLNTYYAIAASLVLAVAAGYLLFMSPQSSPESLYQSYYSPYEDMILERGNSESPQGLQEAMNAYNEGNFEISSAKFITFLDQNPDQNGVWLYLGIAQSETGEYNKAEASFTKARANDQFAQQAMWYNAMSYLKQGKKDKAINQLKEIQNLSNHYKEKEASELLEGLE